MLKIATFAVTKDKSYADEYWKFTKNVLQRGYKGKLTMSPVFFIDEFDLEDSLIQDADLIVVLLSEDFLVAMDEEIEKAVAKKKDQIIPVVLRTCSWKDGYSFSVARAVLDKPIKQYSDQDNAWFAATAALERTVLIRLAGKNINE